MATHKDYNEMAEEGVPNTSTDSGFFGIFYKKKDAYNVLSVRTEKLETARRGEEFEYETSPAIVFFHLVGLFLSTFFLGMSMTIAATVQPEDWTAPVTSTEFWINSFGKSLFALVLICFFQYTSQCPGYTSMLSCIRAPFIAYIFAPLEQRGRIVWKSIVVNFLKLGVIFGTWCLICTATAYLNQGVWTNIGYPSMSIHSGYYSTWWGNFTLIMLIWGASSFIDITLQYRRSYQSAHHEVTSKIWYWPTSPYSFYYDSSTVFWTTILMAGRFFLLYSIFGSFLDPGILLTAPIFDSGNRTSLADYIGAVLAGEGASWFFVLLTDGSWSMFKAMYEKQFLPHNDPTGQLYDESTGSINTDGTTELVTSASGKAHTSSKKPPRNVIGMPSSRTR